MRKTMPFVQALHAWVDISTQNSLRGWAHHARATGLSMPQFSILMQLYRRRYCGISDISDRFEISSAAASQHVENLVQAGLIGRSEDPHDRRAKQIQLSDKGRALLQHGFGARYQWVDQLARAVDPKDYEKVAEALTILAETAHRIEQAQ
ncbi:MAG TPA: MarR family winged helix-turn-helix transcriptional regulator [Anaerolineales bacterium]